MTEDPEDFELETAASETAGDPDAPFQLDVDTEPPLHAAEGRYRSKGQLSKGGMKRIIRVRDTATTRDVAMAVLAPESTHKDEARKRFVHEARITANLEHPNIVPIHDIGANDDGIPFFTMKLLGGETLAKILGKLAKDEGDYRDKYPLSALLMIFLKILDAIAFAHAQGILHLDIKPDNIQVGEFGEVAVLDWGLARANGRQFAHEAARSTVLMQIPPPTFHTLDGEVKGTVGYMAPEQASGRNSDKDERTDIYALGAILFSILSWRRSVSSGKDSEAFDRALGNISAGRLNPLVNTHRPVPAALRAVTLKAMSLNPADRYADIASFRTDIMSYIDGFATDAEHAGPLRRSYLWFCRHRSLSIIVALVILGASIAFSYLHNQAERMVARWGHPRTLVPTESAMARKDWLPVEGEWDLSEGQMIRSVGSTARPARIRYTSPLYGNIAVEFDAMAESRESLLDGGDLSVVLNWHPEHGEDGYFFQIGGISNSVASIQRRNGFQAMIPFIIEPGRIYHIRVEKEGGNLRLFCDGKCLIDVEDMFYLEGGYFGLYAFGGGKRFWNIKIFERGVPELVSPLTEGDAFFRTARSTPDPLMRRYLLGNAHDAYTRLVTEYARTPIGRTAMLRRAHVCLELGDVNAAEMDIITLDNNPENRSFQLATLRAELALRLRNFEAAHLIYSRALTEYPDRRLDIAGILMTHLSDSELFAGPAARNARETFWQMAVSTQRALSFRARTKNLDAIDFLASHRFETLDISGNSVRDLTPVAEMPLRHLNCSGNPITSLAPLRNAPLEYLDCSFTPIASIEPLRGKQIKTLILYGCRRLRDIRALADMPSLERLALPSQIKREQLVQLRDALPNLKFIQYDSADWLHTPTTFFATKEEGE